MQQANVSPIKDQRLKRGLSQRALADLCKAEGAPVTDSQLSKIERGQCMPYPPLRAALSRVLGLDIDLQKVEVEA